MKKRLNARALLLLLIVAGILIQAGCTGVGIGFSVGELKGIVTDSRSGQNIEGVYVEAYSDDYYYDDYDSDWDYTDGSGSYSLSLEGGVYDVYFEKDGYYSEVFRDIGVSSPFSRSLDVQLTPTSTPTPTATPTATPTEVDVAYAASADQNRVSVFSVMSDGTLQANSLSPLTLSAQPGGIAVSRGTSRLYVVTGLDGEAGQVTVFDTATLNQVGSPLDLLQTDGQAYYAAYYTAGNRLYVSRKGSAVSGKIEEIVFSGDTVSATNLITLTVDDPGPMSVNQEDGILFVACPSTNEVVSVDLATGTQLGTVPRRG